MQPDGSRTQETAKLYDEIVKDRKKPETTYKRIVRNIDPFERRRRIGLGKLDYATNAVNAEQFSAAKIRSKKDVRQDAVYEEATTG